MNFGNAFSLAVIGATFGLLLIVILNDKEKENVLGNFLAGVPHKYIVFRKVSLLLLTYWLHYQQEMIILEKDLNENRDSSISETEILDENQDSADVQNNTVTQTKSKYKDFVISSNQMPS